MDSTGLAGYLSGALLYILLGCLLLLPVIVVVYAARKIKQSHEVTQKIHTRLQSHKYEILLYSYDEDVTDIGDITASRFSVYRTTGSIEDYGTPYFEKIFIPDEHTVYELGNILLHASEVKRVSDTTTLYFFKEHIMRSAKSLEIKEIILEMGGKTTKNKNILMSITKQLTEEPNMSAAGGG